MLINTFFAFVVPFTAGSLCASAFLGRSSHWTSIVGFGYLFGALLCALVLYVGAAAFGNFNLFFAYAALLIVSAGSLAHIRKRQSQRNSTFVPAKTTHLAIAAVFIVLAVTHIVVAGVEAWLRPVYPWDAWNSWFPMTLQYLANDGLVAPLNTMKGQAHPPTMNLIEVWVLLASGTNSLVFQLLWPGALLATCMIAYGFLREEGHGPIVSATAFYLIASMPLLATHASLAGYAGIWQSLAATAAIVELSRTRPTSLLRLIVIAGAAMAFKFSGIIISGIAAGFLIVRSRASIQDIAFNRSKFIWATLITLTIVALFFSLFDASDGWIMRIERNVGRASILNPLTLQAISALKQSVFSAMNWNLTPYFLPVALVMATVSMKQQLLTTEHVPLLSVMAFSLVTVIYFLVMAPETAVNQTGFSRALLTIAPSAIIACLALLKTKGQQHC